MDWQHISIGVLGIVCAVLGWLGRELWGAVKDLRKDLDSLRLNIAENYIKRDDLKDRLNEVLQPFRESLAKIERWMEKHERQT